MYNPFENTQVSASAATTANVDETQWSQFLLEAKEIESEIIADNLFAFCNEATTELMENVKAVVSASLDQQGLDHTGGMLVNAASQLIKRFGFDTGAVLAGESFGSEADRLNATILAGESFDVKAKAKQAWEWLMSILKKAKAWVLKLFDGASSLAKSFTKLKEVANKKIQDGKSAETGKKFKLSSSAMKQLTIKGDASKLADTGPKMLQLITSQQSLLDVVFNANMTKIKARIESFEELVNGVNADLLKEGNGDAVRALLAKGDLFKNTTQVNNNCGNSMVLQIAGTESATYAKFSGATSPAVVLREANAQFDATVYKLSAHPDSKNLKFADSKEFPVLGLDEVVKLCDTAVPALEGISRAKDNFNKGMAVEKTLEAAVKSIANLGEDANSVSPALLGIAGKLGNALSNPVGPFSSVFVSVLGAVYNASKDSVNAYTK